MRLVQDADTGTYVCATDPRIRIAQVRRRRWALLLRKSSRPRVTRTEHRTRADAIKAALVWLAENPAAGSALEALRSSLAGTPGFEPHFAAFVAGDASERLMLRDRALDHDGRELDDVLWWAAEDELVELGVMTLPSAGNPIWQLVAHLSARRAFERDSHSLVGGYRRTGGLSRDVYVTFNNNTYNTYGAGGHFRDDELARIRARLRLARIEELGFATYPDEGELAGHTYAMVVRAGTEEQRALIDIVQQETDRTMLALAEAEDEPGRGL
jgi:hypothetical protein